MTIISKVTRKNPMALLLGIIALTGITARAMDDQRAAQIIKNMECPSVEDVLEVYSKVESEEVQIFDVYECFLKDPQVKGMDREEVSKALQDFGRQAQGVNPPYSYDSVEELGNTFKVLEHGGRLNVTTLRGALELDQYKDQELSIKNAIASYEKFSTILGEIVKILKYTGN